MCDWTVMIKEKPGRDPAVQAVPLGFSWGALIFRELWALYRGAWFTALLFVLVVPVLTLVAEGIGLDVTGVLIVQLAAIVMLAMAAAEIRLMELGLRRYRPIATLKARDLDEAEALGLILWTQESRPPAPVPDPVSAQVSGPSEKSSPGPPWKP
ncbi:MAG: DUF2628 domain-containing protein [Rhodospirillales bacterium]|nr:DUF2628 domain-containing protein [Rhodospirillales bacterium]